MSRSKWKYKAIFGKNSKKITWNRNTTIAIPNQFIKIYNGKNFIKLETNEQNLGFKFGEFSPTRTHTTSTKIKKKEKKLK